MLFFKICFFFQFYCSDTVAKKISVGRTHTFCQLLCEQMIQPVRRPFRNLVSNIHDFIIISVDIHPGHYNKNTGHARRAAE